MANATYRAPDEEIRQLYARLADLVRVADRGEVAMTDFLTPREAKYAAVYLSDRLSEGTACAWGGYREAERVRMVLLPDYTAGLTDPNAWKDSPIEALEACGLDDLAAVLRNATVALRVTGSGYRTLTHRDYLGSVLGLGLDRDAVGDIQVADDRTAYLLCKGEIASFLEEGLTKVATDTVRVTRLGDREAVVSCRRFAPVSDTVASARLDCVVAALGNISRDKAQTAIRAGLCELDYETVQDCDAPVEPPCILSIRGVGKFSVKAFDGSTRKGRLRLSAERYI